MIRVKCCKIFNAKFDNKSAYQVGHQLTFTDYIIPLQEVVCMANKPVKEESSNPAAVVLTVGLSSAGITSQLDSPMVGPADVAALGIAAVTVVTAGIVWVANEIITAFRGHDSNIKESNREVHEKGDMRRKRDKRGGEKGDQRRPYRK